MSFHVGQKVVCVDDHGFLLLRGEKHPVAGALYTIRAFHADGDALLLEEIVNPEYYYRGGFGEAYWFCRRFRPVQERSTEIGMAILRKVADDAAKRRNLVIAGH